MTYEAPQIVAAGPSDSLILTGTKLNTCKEVHTNLHSMSAYEVDE